MNSSLQINSCKQAGPSVGAALGLLPERRDLLSTSQIFIYELESGEEAEGLKQASPGQSELASAALG